MFSVCKGKIVLAYRTENILPVNVFVELTVRPQHQRNSSTCSSLWLDFNIQSHAMFVLENAGPDNEILRQSCLWISTALCPSLKVTINFLLFLEKIKLAWYFIRCRVLLTVKVHLFAVRRGCGLLLYCRLIIEILAISSSRHRLKPQ